jgi:protein-L-isoaspartate(D-aspartate) O-methyltransferase
MNKAQLLESLKREGFSSKIIRAFSRVERENFFPEELKRFAYEDNAFPIGYRQTISQPYTIAKMLSLLDVRKGQKALEAGSGSGYVLALISEIVGRAGKVFGLEIVSELATRSEQSLKGYKNVKVYNRNASSGLPEAAPFDRILMSAACEEVPKKLLEQLEEGGILVAPVGRKNYEQSLVAIQRKGKNFTIIKKIPGFVFVPFVESDS